MAEIDAAQAVWSLIKNHRSIRKFRPDPLPEGLLEQLVACGQHASTSSYLQACSVIRVDDSATRQELATLAGPQPWVEQAPIFVVFCGDLRRAARAVADRGGHFDHRAMEWLLVAAVDTALLAQNIMLAAEAAGLGGCFIGGIRNGIDRVSELLALPSGCFALFGLCLGYPAQQPIERPRLPTSVVLHQDRYDAALDGQQIASYEQAVQDYYDQRSKGRLQQGWAEQLETAVGGKQRRHILAYLQRQGVALC